MSKTSYETLRSLPEVERLITILRLDNPLIALGVTKREVSWTQFLAWLLDPVSHSGRLGPLFLEALLDTAHKDIVKLLEGERSIPQENAAMLRNIAALEGKTVVEISLATAEVRGDAMGRIDLLVKCQVGQQPLTVLIENKIEAEESPDQLQNYVQNSLAKLQSEELLLPMLVTVGDSSTEASSCPWAVVWGRERTKRWLELGVENCHAEGFEAPRLVNDYLEVFESWDLASQLRRSHWSLLDQVRAEDPATDDWGLLREPLAVTDRQFFHEVRADTVLRETMKRHNLTDSVYHNLAGRNDGLQISSPRWTIRPLESDETGVNVHFEARRRGDCRLDVELYPYEKNIEARGLTEHFSAQIDVKARLISGLRDILISPGKGVTFHAHTNHLHPAEKPATASAVKFDLPQKAADSPAECAKHFSNVIEQATPLVDSIVQNLKGESALVSPDIAR